MNALAFELIQGVCSKFTLSIDRIKIPEVYTQHMLECKELDIAMSAEEKKRWRAIRDAKILVTVELIPFAVDSTYHVFHDCSVDKVLRSALDLIKALQLITEEQYNTAMCG